VLVAQKVAVGVYKGVTTSELDELAAETAASMTSKHPDYAQVSPFETCGTLAKPENDVTALCFFQKVLLAPRKNSLRTTYKSPLRLVC
jgi:hypothetical protein